MAKNKRKLTHDALFGLYSNGFIKIIGRVIYLFRMNDWFDFKSDSYSVLELTASNETRHKDKSVSKSLFKSVNDF
jgi:predicted metalloenzyme YecM